MYQAVTFWSQLQCWGRRNGGKEEGKEEGKEGGREVCDSEIGRHVVRRLRERVDRDGRIREKESEEEGRRGGGRVGSLTCVSPLLPLLLTSGREVECSGGEC